MSPPGDGGGPDASPSARPRPNQSAEEATTTDKDNPNAAAPGYASAFDTYHRLGWPSVLPLARGTKFPPPTGYTGNDGAVPSYADMMTWADSDKYRDGNLALRMIGMCGIDVDDYDGKTGGATIAEGEKRSGKLPPTFRSTSRSDDVSGIRLYRIPDGVKLVEKIGFPELGLGGVEILQYHHRYAVAGRPFTARPARCTSGSASWTGPS